MANYHVTALELLNDGRFAKDWAGVFATAKAARAMFDSLIDEGFAQLVVWKGDDALLWHGLTAKEAAKWGTCTVNRLRIDGRWV